MKGEESNDYSSNSHISEHHHVTRPGSHIFNQATNKPEDLGLELHSHPCVRRWDTLKQLSVLWRS